MRPAITFLPSVKAVNFPTLTAVMLPESSDLVSIITLENVPIDVGTAEVTGLQDSEPIPSRE